MRVRIDFDIPHWQQEVFIRGAILNGFMRAYPRKAWSQRDRAEAVRWYIARLIKNIEDDGPS